MEKVFAAIFVAVLALTGCIFDSSGIACQGDICTSVADFEAEGVQTDGSIDGIQPDKGKTDGANSDAIKADSLVPDSLQPDSMQPDALVPDSLMPDSLKPCSLSCLNGGTCKVADGGAAYCDCPTGYDPATKCGSCLSAYCGYSTGGCIPMPTITTPSAGLYCGASGCNMNHAYKVPFAYTGATRLKAEISAFSNLITGKVGTFGPALGGPFSTPPYTVTSLTTTTELWYMLADQVLSPTPQPTATIKLTADIPGKPTCTASTTTIVYYK